MDEISEYIAEVESRYTQIVKALCPPPRESRAYWEDSATKDEILRKAALIPSILGTDQAQADRSLAVSQLGSVLEAETIALPRAADPDVRRAVMDVKDRFCRCIGLAHAALSTMTESWISAGHELRSSVRRLRDAVATVPPEVAAGGNGGGGRPNERDGILKIQEDLHARLNRKPTATEVAEEYNRHQTKTTDYIDAEKVRNARDNENRHNKGITKNKGDGVRKTSVKQKRRKKP